MPPIEAENLETEPVKEVAPASKATIGIIYPPPEVRNIVDKTASFVARNGPEFEARIRQNEINNPKFNFLNSSDPYHAYYQHKVKDFQEGKGVEPTFKPQPQSTTLAQQKPEQLKIIEQNIVPKEPPPDYEFIIDPPSISAFDLDVVKLTAQFVARNGRQFLTNLMNREQKNYQFDFLRPQHSLFTYFTKLVEQYTKILIPPKDLLPKLRKEADNFKLVNEKVKQRVDWARYQERERKKEEDERERERVAYAQIDWHDFVVVETVDFQPGETGNFPPPTTPQEVGARVVQQERFDRNEPKEDGVGMDVTSDDEGREAESSEEEEEAEERPPKPSHPGRPQPPAPVHPGDDTQVQDMEEASDEENSDEESQPRKHSAPPPAPPQSLPPLPPKDQLPQPPPLPPNPEQVIVRKGYDPKAPKAVPTAASEDMWVSPLTGEKIAPDKIQEHVRIGLLNPKWIEQRDRAIREKQEQEEVLARGTSIEQSLKRLAERRTDIFGIGVEELQIGRKIGEEEIRQQSKVIWDGHTASMEKVTQKARENISIEEQIATIHKVQGLVQDEAKERIGPSVPKAPAPPVAPPPQPPQPTPPISAPRPPPPSASQSAAGAPYQPMPPRPIAPPIPPQGIAFGLAPAPHIMMQPLGGIQPPPAILGLAPGIPTIIPPRPPQPGFMMPQPQLGQKRPGVPVVEEESSGKKAKTEEQLIPEDVFLQSNKGPVTIKVQIPNVQDKSDMKLNGQTISMSLPLTDSVAVIKAKLHDEVGLPAGKQKLQQDGLFMKDSNTLAFYNLTNNCVVQLQLKERGGRKK